MCSGAIVGVGMLRFWEWLAEGASEVPSRDCAEWGWLGDGGLRRLSELLVEEWSASSLSFSFCFDLVLVDEMPFTSAFQSLVLKVAESSAGEDRGGSAESCLGGVVDEVGVGLGI